MLSLEAPVALTAVIMLKFAEEETTTIEEVCVEGVVMTPELFVSERVVLIYSLGGILVEMPNKMRHCQRFSDWIVLDVRLMRAEEPYQSGQYWGQQSRLLCRWPNKWVENPPGTDHWRWIDF